MRVIGRSLLSKLRAPRLGRWMPVVRRSMLGLVSLVALFAVRWWSKLPTKLPAPLLKKSTTLDLDFSDLMRVPEPPPFPPGREPLRSLVPPDVHAFERQ